MELLCRQPRRNALITWPEEVDRRLDVLVRAATAGGTPASRSQLLAALVAAADTDPDVLAELLRNYRRLPADALTTGNDRDDLPTIRNPGPPRTKDQRTSQT